MDLISSSEGWKVTFLGPRDHLSVPHLHLPETLKGGKSYTSQVTFKLNENLTLAYFANDSDGRYQVVKLSIMVTLWDYLWPCIHALFISNTTLKLAKNQAKTKQHPVGERLLFENISFLHIRYHPK